MPAIFKSDGAAFLKKNNGLVDMVLNHMAVDINRYIVINAGTPVKTGDMKARVTLLQVKHGIWRVISPTEYSAVQEAGKKAGGQPFRHYTTSGTGPHWFQKSIDAITKNANSYIKEAAKAILR